MKLSRKIQWRLGSGPELPRKGPATANATVQSANRDLFSRSPAQRYGAKLFVGSRYRLIPESRDIKTAHPRVVGGTYLVHLVLPGSTAANEPTRIAQTGVRSVRNVGFFLRKSQQVDAVAHAKAPVCLDNFAVEKKISADRGGVVFSSQRDEKEQTLNPLSHPFFLRPRPTSIASTTKPPRSRASPALFFQTSGSV